MTNIIAFPPKYEPAATAILAPSSDYLSFVKCRKRGGGYDYWAVSPSGSYSVDCEAAKRLAEEYLAYIGNWPTNGNATLLTCIVRSMLDQAIAGGKWSGLHVGFLAGVNGHAMLAASAMRDTPSSVQ
jgi:hypothetical protein